jgi:hypothetical protein
MNDNILIILCIIIVLIYYNAQYNTNLHFKQDLTDIPDWNSISNTHILFTRYKEPDMSIILQPFINKKNTKIFIYNKGDDIPSGIPNDATNINIINIPNLGWDSYGFINHVINNYNNLPDYIYNLHASAQFLEAKYNLFIDLLSNNNKQYYGGGLIECDLNFYLNNWSASYQLNKLIHPHETYTLSTIRPLKNWLISKKINIPLSKSNHIFHNWGGMFYVHKTRILLYPISFYKEILDEISVWQSEVNHYLERSWYILYNI